jgi:hypothetical protein
MSSETTSNAIARKPYNWRLLGILVAMVLVSVILITPYALSLQSATLANQKLPIPLTILIPIQWLQTTILYGILAATGLFIANRIGLGLPFIESWLAGKPDWAQVRKFALPAIIAGVAAAIVIIILDAGIFSPQLVLDLQHLGLKMPAAASGATPAWEGFLASFYGGTTEEILLRLFALSLFAWIGRFVNRAPDGHPGEAALWAANILAAILFGLGHLPATATAGLPMDALVITRAVVLNGLAGLVFGWFYWKHGLEAAMLSHFSSDIVLHVILPLLTGH